MLFKFIESYKDISFLIDGPYNSPESETDAEDFDREYEQFRDGLEDIIAGFCLSEDVLRESIHIGHRTGPSRGIGLVVEENCSVSLIKLIGKIHGYLKILAEDYCVAINLILDEHGDFKDLNFGLTKSEEVLIHADQSKWFKEVGIDC